ncbi:MAG: aspartate kinase [Chloroflexota bacterium]|nr:aspartate kinase [Chloroflexota bacterium]
MSIIVQKYGGSSVSDVSNIANVAERICKSKDKGFNIVVVVSAMGNSTDQLVELARSITDSPDPRELDALLATGEVVSCSLLAITLKHLGYDTVSLTGYQVGVHTDDIYGNARINLIDQDRIRKELSNGRIVVIAGFQGITDDLNTTTLGRGGSDTTAVALAAVLNADRCEVYTDVDGIYTADPRIVSRARKIREIGYEDMLELASIGAKMHPRSIELGAVYHVPIYVASSFNNVTGTLIHDQIKGNDMENRYKVTGVAYQLGLSKITVRSLPDRPGIAANLFEPLASVGISVDTIVQNASQDKTTDISFTVETRDLERTLGQVLPLAENIGASGVVNDDGLSCVSIVGSGMQNSPGYASHMFRILADGEVNIDMITTSEIRISCIIKEEQVLDAVRLLHTGFGLDQGG